MQKLLMKYMPDLVDVHLLIAGTIIMQTKQEIVMAPCFSSYITQAKKKLIFLFCMSKKEHGALD